MKKRGKWRAIFVLGCILVGLGFVLIARHIALGGRGRNSVVSFSRTWKASPAAPAQASWPENPRRDSAGKMPEGINAADLFKNAFVLFDALTPEEKNILSHPKEEVDVDKAEALFKKIQPILALLHRAAKADYCDWCLGPMNFSQPTTHLAKAAKLGQVSLWAAGFQFPANPEAALDTLSDRIEIGHALAGNGMIGMLVETSMERGATQLIVQNASTITPALTAQFKAMLQSSILEEDVAQALESEVEGLNDQVNKWTGPATGKEDSVLDAQRTSLQDPAFRQKLVESVQVQKEFVKMVQASDAEFDRWMAGIKTASTGNAFIEMSSSVLGGVRSSLREAMIERTMLGAGLDIMQNGPAQAGTFMEPGSQTPFIYRQTTDGFELQSRSQFKGKPITLRFPSSSAPGGKAP